MQLYKNSSGNSGVASYETGKNYIKIMFTGGDIYLYNNVKPGKTHVLKMKDLAQKGQGLSTYISRHVKDHYFEKLN